MKINSHERYGQGPCLATKQERLFNAAVVVLFASVIGLAVVGALLWA